jgi:hypothetical protein
MGSPNAKSNRGAFGPLLGLKDNLGHQLGKVTHYKGVLAVIVDAAKKEGMRFDIMDFPHGDVKCLNQDVMTFPATRVALN